MPLPPAVYSWELWEAYGWFTWNIFIFYESVHFCQCLQIQKNISVFTTEIFPCQYLKSFIYSVSVDRLRKKRPEQVGNESGKKEITKSFLLGHDDMHPATLGFKTYFFLKYIAVVISRNINAATRWHAREESLSLSAQNTARVKRNAKTIHPENRSNECNLE